MSLGKATDAPGVNPLPLSHGIIPTLLGCPKPGGIKRCCTIAIVLGYPRCGGETQ